MKRPLTICAVLLLMSRGAFADLEDLICQREGMAGVAFGQKIDEQRARVYERVDSGVTYYFLGSSIDTAPFQDLIVGVTPVSRQVFSISLELHGSSGELDEVTEQLKRALAGSHPELQWRVHDNYHYGEQLDDLELVIYRTRFGTTFECKRRAWPKGGVQEDPDAL